MASIKLNNSHVDRAFPQHVEAKATDTQQHRSTNNIEEHEHLAARHQREPAAQGHEGVAEVESRFRGDGRDLHVRHRDHHLVIIVFRDRDRTVVDTLVKEGAGSRTGFEEDRR